MTTGEALILAIIINFTAVTFIRLYRRIRRLERILDSHGIYE